MRKRFHTGATPENSGAEEQQMKAASKVTIAMVLGACAALACPSARAQAEISPDHFDSPDMIPFGAPTAAPPASAAALDYSGEVMLSHRVRVDGQSLAAGKYEVSLHSDGKTVELRLNRRGQTVAVQTVAYHNVPRTERGYLVVERRGNIRRLSVIHAGLLQLVFAPETSGLRATGAASLEVLPLAFVATES
jgi:hypothetical protein